MEGGKPGKVNVEHHLLIFLGPKIAANELKKTLCRRCTLKGLGYRMRFRRRKKVRGRSNHGRPVAHF